MSDSPPNLIQFTSHESQTAKPPAPAAQNLPEWIKQMPREVMGQLGSPPVKISSVKQCLPFVDAMTCGYVIPLVGDARFTMHHGGKLEVTCNQDAILTQDPAQIAGSPFEGKPIVKFRNTWVVQTPPGYSTLFLPLLNQFTMPFHILAGLVDTDVFYMHVYFPSICLLQPGQQFEMKQGTPLVQAIPIKRDAWTSEHGPIDMDRFMKVAKAHEANRHEYRDAHWQKKKLPLIARHEISERRMDLTLQHETKEQLR